MTTEAGSLAERVLNGERRALSRLLTAVENGTEPGREALRALYPHTGRARTIGLTGSPGSGKSTVTNELTKELRRRGRTVGILAVDPSSPFTHGAILGDRVRMQDLTADPEIFLRSLATRGSLGGLSEGTLDCIAVLDAFGKDVILIETVGAGQDEVEIAATAQTTVLINTPGMGDDIQTMKAGIMEIADILAVNKADLPGADVLMAQLRALLTFSTDRSWDPPILRLIATQGEGLAELADACDQHFAFLQESGRLQEAARGRVRQQIIGLARTQLLAGLVRHTGGEERLEGLVDSVVRRTIDPHTAVAEWIGEGLRA
ncbi:MAG: methylmalonyl Co-A mutase-associated GTPase MeaB [Dehalococcoidia bacterium]